MISLQGISPFLDDKSLVENIHIYSELASTNLTAKEMARTKKESGGHIIIANRQSAGRGRRERVFFSPQGGIYISFIIKPEKTFIDKAHLFTVAAAVAACEAIEEAAGLKPGIKWINDILLHGKKVGGILTESEPDMEKGTFKWVVAGIGINFSISEQDFPEEIKVRAGSLYPKGDAPISVNCLAGKLINKMTAITTEESLADTTGIMDVYRKRLETIGKRVQVFCAGKTFFAQALDVDERGSLIVKKDDGTIEILSSGEVSLSP